MTAAATRFDRHWTSKPADLDWTPNPDKPGNKICIATSTGTPKLWTYTTDKCWSTTLIEGLYPQLMYLAKTAREYGDWIGTQGCAPVYRPQACADDRALSA